MTVTVDTLAREAILREEKSTPRLFVRGRVLSYKRGMRQIHPNTVLIRIDDVQRRVDTEFYMNKKVAYIYKVAKAKNGSKLKVRWGTIYGPHGNSGVVKARFERNLNGSAFGQECRVYMFPCME